MLRSPPLFLGRATRTSYGCAFGAFTCSSRRRASVPVLSAAAHHPLRAAARSVCISGFSRGVKFVAAFFRHHVGPPPFLARRVGVPTMAGVPAGAGPAAPPPSPPPAVPAEEQMLVSVDAGLDAPSIYEIFQIGRAHV